MEGCFLIPPLCFYWAKIKFSFISYDFCLFDCFYFILFLLLKQDTPVCQHSSNMHLERGRETQREKGGGGGGGERERESEYGIRNLYSRTPELHLRDRERERERERESCLA